MKFKTILIVILKNIEIWLYKFLGLENKIVPYKILINLTNNCNSRCTFCSIWQINKENVELMEEEIGLNDVVNIFKDLNKNLLWLSLSGGEVTLVSYYKEMILAAKKYCPNLKILTFTTNAIASQRAVDYALFAKSQGLDVFVNISLDGDKNTHDTLRGIPGGYDSCLKTYDLMKINKVVCYFGLTISDLNYEFIKDKYKEMNDSMKSITFVHSGGIYNKINQPNYNKIYKGLEYIYKNYKLNHVSEIIEKIHIKISLFFVRNEMRSNIIPCEVMNTSVHIMPYGEIKPCMYLPSLGNIKNDKITQVYSSDEAAKIRKLIKKDECPHCWMNCYSPHSIMQHPLKSLWYLLIK